MVRVITVGAITLLIAGAAHAQMYGNYTSPNYQFLGVQESSGTDPGPLFGAPIASGAVLPSNALTFSPTNFVSSATAGPGGFASDITDGQLNFTINALPGSFINQFIFAERGDYTLAGLPSASATATVGCLINVRVTEVNGSAIVPQAGQFNLLFTNAGVFTFPPPVAAGSWSGIGAFDVDAFLASRGIMGMATRVEISLDNTLTTTAANGASATIEKKQIEGLSVTVIPAPGAAALLGLGGLLAARRRR